MDGEITRKSVLIEALQIMREELDICSEGYNGLIPKRGMEEAWDQARRKVQIMQDLIHAYESEPVRKALADWQKDVMEQGPVPLSLEELMPPSQRQESKKDGHQDADVHRDQKEWEIPGGDDTGEPGLEMEPVRI